MGGVLLSVTLHRLVAPFTQGGPSVQTEVRIDKRNVNLPVVLSTIQVWGKVGVKEDGAMPLGDGYLPSGVHTNGRKVFEELWSGAT